MSLTIVRTFPATREQVFDAWTDPAQFAVWFGTTNAPVDEVEMDVRPGGAWKARMVIDDGATVIPWNGSYREVDRPTHLVLTLNDGSAPQFEVVTVDLAEVADGTEMTVTQSGGNLDAADYEGAKAGYQAFFDDLEKHLASL